MGKPVVGKYFRPGNLKTLRRASPKNRKFKSHQKESLAEVNKLVFVQEYERASLLLTKLSKLYPADYEVHFRRIEVACRTSVLDEVFHDYMLRSMRSPQVLALQYAATLAEIRLLEKAARSAEQEHDTVNRLINPSLRGSVGGDVFGLSAAAEMHSVGGHLLQGSQRNLLLSPSIEGTRKSQILSKTIRIARSPLIADDAALTDPPHLPDHYLDGEFKHDKSAGVVTSTPCIDRAIHYKDRNPGNYAAWFLAGCAYEYAGKLAQAIDAWTHAAKIAPDSVSVLATMAELQMMGAISNDGINYGDRFEEKDCFLVHGSFDTHLKLYHEYLEKNMPTEAIAALRTLADWLQKQRGEVPQEIEILCLLGAMKAYRSQGKTGAADACLKEAEFLIIDCKKTSSNASQLIFVGQICEEYGLASLGRICFSKVLTSSDTPLDQIIRTAAHIISCPVTPATREGLRVAYKNSNGNSEIRFCRLLCELYLAKVSAEKYLQRKNKIRDAMTHNDVGHALTLLSESFEDTLEDSETHLYMGEILARIGTNEKAADHFKSMYEIDYLNVETVMRYALFLMKIQNYALAKEVSKKVMANSALTTKQLAEIHWIKATAGFAEHDVEEAKVEISKSLQSDPWNLAYLVLGMRLNEPSENDALPHTEAMRHFEVKFLSKGASMPSEVLDTFLDRGLESLRRGYAEYAYLLGKTLLTLHPDKECVVDFYCRSAAGFHSRTAAQEALQLLRLPIGQEISFSRIAALVARTYVYAAEWPLVQEWIDIAEKSGTEDRFVRSKMFEIEALRLVIAGVNLSKAKSLLEASMDVFENGQGISPETQILYGYVLVLQGNIKPGLERIEQHTNDTLSIQSLYFYIKALQRSGKLNGREKESIARFYRLIPTNALEQKFIEEIYCTVGTRELGTIIPLIC